MPRKLQTAVALLTVLAAVSVAPGHAAATATDPTRPLSFDVELAQVEGSGVTGIAHLVLRGDQLTVLIRAFGFEPHQVVPVSLHGFSSGQQGPCSTVAEEPQETAAASRAGSDGGGAPATLALRRLDPPPRADVRGAVISQQTFTVDASRLTPLEGRVLVLRNAEDDDGRPLACGRMIAYR